MESNLKNFKHKIRKTVNDVNQIYAGLSLDKEI